ncbi:hypothetical protein [Mycoavidus sp. B2-EB]|uniref:hypothetical protein n=1 Tax=Mycoavidus sp. B2-EB TaxID=2651972 RepID=UPI00162ACEB8|nr:hypothetical protein [Mycoavidus sp. B2-EB]BBO59794.1 hypothetical protein MPB2EB_0920 [Mycoavidus sp. B2-EB]
MSTHNQNIKFHPSSYTSTPAHPEEYKTKQEKYKGSLWPSLPKFSLPNKLTSNRGLGATLKLKKYNIFSQFKESILKRKKPEAEKSISMHEQASLLKDFNLPEIPSGNFYLSFSEELGKLKNQGGSVFSDEFMQSFIQDDVNYILDKMKPIAEATSMSSLNDAHKTNNRKTAALQNPKVYKPKSINNIAREPNKRITVELSAQKAVFQTAHLLKPNPALKKKRDEAMNKHSMTVTSFATRVPLKYGSKPAQPATATLIEIAPSA